MCTLPVKLCSGVHSYHTRETINSYTEAASIMFEILCHTAPILFLSSILSSASLIIQLVYTLNNYYDTTPPLLHSNRDLEPFPGLTIDSQLYSTTAIMILSASSCLPLTVLCGGGSVGWCMGGVVGGGGKTGLLETLSQITLRLIYSWFKVCKRDHLSWIRSAKLATHTWGKSVYRESETVMHEGLLWCWWDLVISSVLWHGNISKDQLVMQRDQGKYVWAVIAKWCKLGYTYIYWLCDLL